MQQKAPDHILVQTEGNDQRRKYIEEEKVFVLLNEIFASENDFQNVQLTKQQV